MADTLAEDEDVVMVYGATAHSVPQSQPKIRHLQNDDSSKDLSSNNNTSAFEEITNDMVHCELDQEDQEELLNPARTRFLFVQQFQQIIFQSKSLDTQRRDFNIYPISTAS